jgi:hypothetical protein
MTGRFPDGVIDICFWGVVIFDMLVNHALAWLDGILDTSAA